MSGKKILKRVLIAIPAVLVLLIVAAGLFLRTRTFNRWVLAEIIQRAERSTGARIQVQKVQLHWSPLTADLYGIVARGKESAKESPLFQAEHLEVSVGIRALLKHQVDLYSVALDRPIVAMRVDSRGNSNLPTAPPSQPSSFSILVRHASLRDGRVNYNNYQIPLDAELDNVHFLMAYDPASGMYKGSLGYGPGRLDTRSMRPIPHKADVQFSMNQNQLELNRAVISSGRTQISLRGRVADFSNPKVEMHYEGAFFTEEVAEILRNPSLGSGEIRFAGNLDYHSSDKEPFLKAAALDGWLSSPAVAVHTPSLATSVRAIHATYRLHAGTLTVPQLAANIFGGQLSARAEIRNVDATPSSRVDVSLRDLLLEQVSNAAMRGSERIHLLGRANLVAQANWVGSISATKAHAQIDVTGPNKLDSAQKTALPVNGNIHVDYDAAQQRASFGKSQIRVAQTELTLSGEVSRRSQLTFDLNANDLHELATLASNFSTPSPAPGAPPGQPSISDYDLRGSAHLTGQISGPTKDPQITGGLSAENLQVQGSNWRALRLRLNANSSSVAIQDGYLQSARQGEINLSGRVALRNWSFAPEDPIELQAKLANISVTDLERIAKVQYPVSGNLSGDMTVSGSELQPLGHGAFQLTNASAWDEPIQTLQLNFQGDKNTVQSTLRLQLPAGSTNAKLTIAPATKHYQLSLNASGLRLARLQNVQQRNGILAGTLTASVNGEGTLSDPQLSANLQIPDLQVSGQNFSGFNAKLDVAHHRATADVDSVVQQGFVQAKGSVELTGAYAAHANIDIRALPIGPLLAQRASANGTTQNVEGYTEIHATLDGPLKDPERLQGQVEIPRLNFGYQGMQLANDGPLRISYRQGIAHIEQARIRGTGTDLSLQGAVPVQSTVPLSVFAKGTIDVSLLQLFSPDVHSSGKLEFDLNARGALKQPQTEGTVRIVNTALAVEDAPLSLSALNAQLSISGNRINIDRLQGTSGGGTISANGSATYGKETNFAVDLHTKGVRIHSTGIRSLIDSDLQLNGTPAKSTLTGKVIVDQLSFQQGFDLASLMDQLSDNSTVSAPSPFASNMKLGITVQSSQNLSLTSSQVSIAGSANLNVSGTAANPVILGRVALTSGELFFQGKRFEIQNGTIAFTNPARTEPVLNLYVKTVVEQYNITINFAGPIDRLKTSYTSDPSLPPLDIINLLAFGQTSAEKASNASTPASIGAESALAQGAAGQVASHLQNLTGISQLTIDPTAGSSQNPGAQLAVQQRVTGTLLLTFSTDVTSTQRQTVQLQYQLKPQWKISVVRDEYGGYGIDVRLHKVF